MTLFHQSKTNAKLINPQCAVSLTASTEQHDVHCGNSDIFKLSDIPVTHTMLTKDHHSPLFTSLDEYFTE